MIRILFQYLFVVTSTLIFTNLASAQTCEEEREQRMHDFLENCNTNSNSCPTDGSNAWGKTTILRSLYNGVTSLDCHIMDCVYGQISYAPYSVVLNSCGGDNPLMQTIGGVKISKINEKPLCKAGSVIDIPNRALGEQIALDGINFALSYYSEYQNGRSDIYQASMPLSDGQVFTTLSSIDVTVKDLAGNTYSSTSYPNAINLTHQFTWNGLDHLGNPLNSPKTFVFKAVEHRSYSGGSVLIPYESEITIGSFKSKYLGLGGWQPDILHFFDKEKNILYYASGAKREVVPFTLADGTLLIPEKNSDIVYHFSASGRHTSTKHKKTGVALFTFSYDGAGRLSSITEPFSRVTTIERDLSGNFTAIISPKNQRSPVTLDSNGYLATISTPDSRIHTLQTSSTGLLQSFQKPGGQISSFTYNSDGTLLKDQHSGGYFTELVKTISGNDTLISANSPLSTSTQYSFNPKSQRQSTTTQSGRQIDEEWGTNQYSRTTASSLTFIENYSSDPTWGSSDTFTFTRTHSYPGMNVQSIFAKTSSVTDPADPFSLTSETTTETLNGFTSPVTYDASTKTYSAASFEGRNSSLQIDNWGRPVSYQLASFNPATYTYTNENLTKVTQGSRETNFAYDSLTGNLLSVTDPLSRVTSYTYNSANRVSQVQLPDLRTIIYGYDSNGNITSIDNPARKVHEFDFGSNELVSSYVPTIVTGTYPIDYTYDAANRITQVSKGPGRTIDVTYHSTLGYPNSITTKEGTYSIQFFNGKPLEITSPSDYRINYGYGALNTSSSQFSPGSTYYFAYNQVLDYYTGNVSSEASAFATGSLPTINYSYDNDSLLTAAGDISITRSATNGTVSTTTIGNITDSYTYNSYGELTGYQSADPSRTLYSITLVRDGIGRISEKTETIHGYSPITYNYTYDLSGRLIEVKENTVVVATYTYDNNGNRNGGTIRGTAQTANYDDQDRLIAYNSNSFSHGVAGEWLTRSNSTSGITTTYSYSELGGLMSVVPSTGTQITYDLDGLDRRVVRKVNGTIDKRYYYDTLNRVIVEADAAGALIRRYVYATKSHVPDYFIEGGENYKIVSDYLGSPRVVVKVSDGTIVQKMNQDEFGRVRLDTNPGTQSFGFAGGLYDSQTSLVRFGARDYDPEVGRWTAKDPILFGGGDANLFGYVANDPVNWVDPDGLKSIKISAFKGLGGSLTIGLNPDGRPFMTMQFGYGFGGGFSYDPNGKSPKQACPGSGLNSSIGAYAEGSFTAGRFDVGTSAGAGAHSSKDSKYYNYFNPLAPGLATQPSKRGVEAGFSIGAEVSFY